MTLDINDAFRKFKSRLELNEKERQNAAKRQNEVRDFLNTHFSIANSFLTGSYARYTKTKPLRDIDIFVVLKDRGDFRGDGPSVVIQAFYDALVGEYGAAAVRKQTRSLNVDFGVVVQPNDDTDYRIVSVDVVPAYADGDNYEIPDTGLGKWIKTNPKIHADQAVQAHQAFSNEWKGLVRMVKYWNANPRHGKKPVKPSFLIEVMAMECLHGGFQGRFDYELQTFFASLADRIDDQWADPAGMGPPVSDGMDAIRRGRAKTLLAEAAKEASIAINHSRQGRNGEALKAWRAIFGPKFPLS